MSLFNLGYSNLRRELSSSRESKVRKAKCKDTKVGHLEAELFMKRGDAYIPYRFDPSAITDGIQKK